MPTSDRAAQPGAAFLLTQLGTHAAARFAEQVGMLDLTPPEAGVLGLLRGRPGISQQQLADVLGMIPSRVVPLVDGLEGAGYVERVRDDTDRRRNSLQLTARGKRAVEAIGRVGRQHEHDITRALSAAEREQLFGLLRRIADDQGLTPGVHPGYRTLKPAARS
jgi:DNA-binding MarR family transcriptional regulator